LIKIFINIVQRQTNKNFAFKYDCNVDKDLVAVTYGVVEPVQGVRLPWWLLK